MDAPQELYSAVESGDALAVAGFLSGDPQMASAYDGNMTLLHWASSFGHYQIVESLLRHGADVNAPMRDMPEAAIYSASLMGYTSIVQLLLQHGARSDFELDDPAYGHVRRNYSLCSAAGNGRFEIVKLLVEYGADVNATYAGQNALSDAQPYPEIVAYLRLKGAKTPEELGLATSQPTPPKAKKGKK